MQDWNLTINDIKILRCEWRIYPVTKGERMADELPNIAPYSGYIVAPCLFRPKGPVMRNHAAIYITHNPPIHRTLKEAEEYKQHLDKTRPWPEPWPPEP